MSKCSVSGQQFVNFVFGPSVGLLTSTDVEQLFSNDHLSFVDLLKPFSQISRDVSFTDSNNLIHTVRNLRLNFNDIRSRSVSLSVTKAHLRDIVKSCSIDYSAPNHSISDGVRSVAVPISVPWFEAWRYIFIKSLPVYEHEFLLHNLACIFVISTLHPNPLEGFTDLTQQQGDQQYQRPGSYPFWFTENTLKFYLLVHDASQVCQTVADEIYSQMQATFGPNNCFLLTVYASKCKDSKSVNVSAKQNTTNCVVYNNETGTKESSFVSNHSNYDLSTSDTLKTDPWLYHLLPHAYKPTLLFPKQSILSKFSDAVNPTCVKSLSDTNKISENVLGSRMATDPLTKNKGNRDVSSELYNFRSIEINGLSDVQTDSVSFLPRHCNQLHGQNLVQSDRDRIQLFINEFTVRALLPWVEKTMRSLNDQITHRIRLSRSFFSATRKFFSQAVSGGTSFSSTAPTNTNVTMTRSSVTGSASNTFSSTGMSSTATGSNDNAVSFITNNEFRNKLPNTSLNSSATLVSPYSSDSPELQMRRLADLAFLFQHYEIAYQTYNYLKRDFQNDSQLLYLAGAQEMSALSVYLQGNSTQRQYPYHYIDSAVSNYLQLGQNFQLALRATLLNVEALCSYGLYSEASAALLRLTSEDDDLVNALLIEQMAYCMLKLKRPMLRKFAFRMAIAAHRYNRANQPHLVLHSYGLTLPIVTGRGWSLIEDHINFNLGKQACLIGDWNLSHISLKRTIRASSQQSAERQLLFVNEYLTILNHVLSNNLTDANVGTTSCTKKCDLLPEFPLPIIIFDQLRIMVGKPTKQEKVDDPFIEARGNQFTDIDDVNMDLIRTRRAKGADEDYINEDELLFSQLKLLCDNQFVDEFPYWMEGTDVSDESDTDELVIHHEHDQSKEITGSSHSLRMTITDGFTTPTICYRKPLSDLQLTEQLELLLTLTCENDNRSNQSSVSPSTVFERFPTILTPRTKLQNTPVVPMGEHLTVQIPLKNPMRIPLILINLHLLWIFKFFKSPTATVESNMDCQSVDDIRHTVTNESLSPDADLMMNKVVASQILPEFIMFPGEQKLLQLSLCAGQIGDLIISAIGFDWTYMSPPNTDATNTGTDHNSHVNPLNLSDSFEDLPFATWTHSANLSTPLNTTTTDCKHNSVKGKIVFETFASSQEKLSPLHWCVVQPLPILKVYFNLFPTKLYEGQLFPIQLKLVNAGPATLSRLRVASNWPGFMALGLVKHELDVAEQTLSLPALKPWLNIPLGHCPSDSRLKPNSAVTHNLWLRAPHLLGHSSSRSNHSEHYEAQSNVSLTFRKQNNVNLVFHYETITSSEHNYGLNRPFVRHRCNINLMPSLQIKATTYLNGLANTSDLIIGLRVRNLVPPIRNAIFQLTQITCVSNSWTIYPMVNHTKIFTPDKFLIRANEISSFYLKASPKYKYSSIGVGSTRGSQDIPSFVSTIHLSDLEKVNRGAFMLPDQFGYELVQNQCTVWSPQLELYARSGLHWSTTSYRKNNSSSSSPKFRRLHELNLIITWKVTSDDFMNICAWGQSHVRIRRPHDNKNSSLNRLITNWDCLSSHLSNLIQVKLTHPKSINLQHSLPNLTSHQLTGLRVAKIPVHMKLYNSAQYPVLVQLVLNDLKASKPKALASSSLQVASISGPSEPPNLKKAHSLLWTGLNCRHFTMQPNELKQLDLQAIVFHPGTYNVRTFTIKVANPNVQHEPKFIQQNCVTPDSLSLIIVQL